MNRAWLLAALLPAAMGAARGGPQEAEMPLLLSEDFEKGADRWEPTDSAGWKIADGPTGKCYSQFQKKSAYTPPHRSPFHIALLKGIVVEDFVLEAKVQSTVKDYPHRDACLFFGYQDASHFYYAHLGKKTDPQAHQIMIVNGAPRTKITVKNNEGTDWTDNWHSVRVVRKVADGTIEVYFDDMKTPCMTASDKTFAWGRVGLGTFDDTANWDDVRLRGVKAGPPR
jgi:hypothetical protein